MPRSKRDVSVNFTFCQFGKAHESRFPCRKKALRVARNIGKHAPRDTALNLVVGQSKILELVRDYEVLWDSRRDMVAVQG